MQLHLVQTGQKIWKNSSERRYIREPILICFYVFSLTFCKCHLCSIIFIFQIETLSKVNHKNFVNLIGFCEEEKPFTRMMVFEYAPNGTLFEHLHGEHHTYEEHNFMFCL